jgi:hypothetical protein
MGRRRTRSYPCWGTHYVPLALIVATMPSHIRNWLIALLTWLFAASGVHAALADPLVVDPGSIGGACSDARLPVQVSPTTPWCSIAGALKTAPSGSTVYLRGGTYPTQVLQNVGLRTDYVALEPYGYGGPAPETVTINGIKTQNTSFLRFEGLHLVGQDTTGFLPAASIYTQSHHIQLINNDITGQGIFLQTAANVLLQGNYIHNLTRNCAITHIGDGGGIFLIGANSGFFPSHDIQLLGNRIEGTYQDAINVGSISNLLIQGNDVSTTGHALCGDHTDLTQIEGGRMGPITITDNVFHDGGQFILRNATGLTIENNLILRVNQWMQLEADPGARVINNTWSGGNANCSGCGSLIIRNYAPGSSFTKPPFNYVNQMTGAVVENNIMRLFANNGVPTAAYHEDYNLIYGPKANSTGIHGRHTIFAMPTFANAAAGDYTLAARSVGIDSADSTVAPSVDLSGRPRWDDPLVPNSGSGPIPFVDRGAVEWTPPPAAPPAAPPPLSVRAISALTRRGIKHGVYAVRLTCNATCQVTVTARLTMVRQHQKHHRSHRRGHTSRRSHKRAHLPSFRLRGVRTRVPAGRQRTLKLRLLKASTTRVRRAARPFRGHVVLVVHLRARDQHNRVATETVRIRLRI